MLALNLLGFLLTLEDDFSNFLQREHVTIQLPNHYHWLPCCSLVIR